MSGIRIRKVKLESGRSKCQNSEFEHIPDPLITQRVKFQNKSSSRQGKYSTPIDFSRTIGHQSFYSDPYSLETQEFLYGTHSQKTERKAGRPFKISSSFLPQQTSGRKKLAQCNNFILSPTKPLIGRKATLSFSERSRSKNKNKSELFKGSLFGLQKSTLLTPQKRIQIEEQQGFLTPWESEIIQFYSETLI